MMHCKKQTCSRMMSKLVAYSYIGPELTYPIYREGTIGRAKIDLEETARRFTNRFL